MGGRGSNSGLKGAFAFLGKRHKAATIDSALSATNPHYKEGIEWRYNCQRCVYAYEMQRRGYDVEALPRIFDGSDTLPYMTHKEGWLNVMEGAKLVDLPSHNTLQRMADQMHKWGDGARAIVRVVWKGGKSGHVFVAEQQNGGTVFVDPQSGKYVDAKSYLDGAVKKYTKLVRMDNLKPTALLEKCVKRR